MKSASTAPAIATEAATSMASIRAVRGLTRNSASAALTTQRDEVTPRAIA